MIDTKYITFKHEDWDAMVEDHRIRPRDQEGFRRWADAHMLRDSVVIRTKDAFSGPVLHVYANTIGVAAKCIGMMAPDVSKRFQKIADYFHERALEADANESKLPD